jgi:hypothetical protein
MPEDTQSLSTSGAILKLAYQLRRHLWLEWSLARWLGVLLLGAALGSLFVQALRPWAALAIGLFFLGYLVLLRWASRHRYIRYAPLSLEDVAPSDLSAVRPLRVEELVPVRASGLFSVEGKEQYYVDLEADFETVGTREHIILGRVLPSKFLVVGHWSYGELGWWYIFVRPAMLRGLGVGLLYFGAEPLQTLRVVYAPEPEVEQTVYLTFQDDSALRRVWNDLLLDAPADLVLDSGGR